MVPQLRYRALNDAPVNPAGEHVLYWMIAYRRTGWNFALDRALEWSEELGKPLLILEALRCGYRWASERLHRFVLDGMADNRRVCRDAGVTYYPYVEPNDGADKGLLAALAERACLVVSDDYPAFFLPHMLRAAAAKVPVLFEAVDSNGLLPLRAADKVHSRAYLFRRFLQKVLPSHLGELPDPDPLPDCSHGRGATVPTEIVQRWAPVDEGLLKRSGKGLSLLPIDHDVQPGPLRGGSAEAVRFLRRFVNERLSAYGELRNHPDEAVTSELSPYLHFGHVAPHQIFAEVMLSEGWSEDLLASRADGSRSGWWGTSGAAEAFLDQLITWRELGFNFAAAQEDYDQYETLPNWAVNSLAEHASDPRPYRYTQEQLETADTHDQLWNAAQRQLLREGRIHNYLRMLWGKKILEWTASPREALRIMLELNDRYALDGRDPNSISGIFWCLGRYDRAWGPERPVFGKIRYMSSDNTRRKVRLRDYLCRYGPES